MFISIIILRYKYNKSETLIFAKDIKSVYVGLFSKLNIFILEN